MMASKYRDGSFNVVDVRRAEVSEADASILLIDEEQGVIRLHLSTEVCERLCLCIAEALEDKYGP